MKMFGNTLWFAPILVRKDDYFLILCKNYSKILITVIMTKTVLRSTVNRLFSTAGSIHI